MEIILLEDIDKLGEQFEVVEVADGYARNFLLPQGKAQMATDSNLKQLEQRKEKQKQQKQARKQKLEDMISKLEGRKFTFEMKVGDKDQLYESITAQKIANKLQDEDFEVTESNVQLSNPIKELTTTKIQLEFDFDFSTEVTIQIVEK